ncbi:16S rRNA (adenine(1518)-N(6)/adenine(1519)-N(6))-dimethyltransferase RsmA [Phaeovibrio sulfidiphilus]|uniref:Ribosomal RNA small subunit methyltransferase A n=1 Tax=Phaeovibrio sulfidiphilus TaxID=1220600 RepID=A0A8J7CWT2_9PROT|nr:16S rRNA (adenine(1518)-N(6)/adenine(1519)-N(6))-dimethyltransferase RsmA [Phaeovibrio sulfidiphilus]MBE1237891.1 16S rRNA (adenine(1518)-N(6)/adenine(1519)-N(6))-dimethyltransferase RsmA [Phaeovibrio sulfidiphilus]
MSAGDDLSRLPPLREVIETHGLAARKSLGQNFLLDLNLTAKIARCAGDLDGATVIEVGPGPGGLTRALLGTGACRVYAIERDPRPRAALDQIAAVSGGRLEIIEGDALQVNVAALGEAPRVIVANLPYNIATELLIGWLKQITEFQCLVLMFQKEVVDRLAARPATKAYGRLSVLTQWLCRVSPQFDLNPRAFVPPPKVVSTVVRLDPLPEPLAPARIDLLERVTAAAFGQRRKMLRSSLAPLGDPEALCEAAGLAPTDRAETIPVEGFAALARALEAR